MNLHQNTNTKWDVVGEEDGVVAWIKVVYDSMYS